MHKHKHIHKINYNHKNFKFYHKKKHKIVINSKNVLIKNNCDFKVHILNSGGYKNEYSVIHDFMFIY